MKNYVIAFILSFLFSTAAYAQFAVSGSLSTGQDRITGVTAGSYTCTDVTFDATGRATAASNGSCSGGGGGGSPAVNIQTAGYTITTSDCWTTVQMGTGSTGQITVTLPSASGFTDGCMVYVKNGDTARGKILSGFPYTGGILWPQQAIGVQVINGAWQTIYNPGRWRVPSTQVIHVDAVNGSNSNDGLASGAGGAVADAQTARTIAAYKLDANGTTTVIAMACGQTHTVPLYMGGIPLGNNLIELAPDGNCAFSTTTTGPMIVVGDLAEININLTKYGSSGGWNCNSNTSNAVSTGCIYAHNDAVVDLTGTPTWTPGGANDNFLFCDGSCRFTIANGITQAGSGWGNYIINMSQGGTGTQSGTISASGGGRLNGVYYLFGGAMLSLGTPNGSGWGATPGTSKIYAQSVLVNNGITPAGGVSVGATGVNCTSLTGSC